jgi:hypothetical protein
MRAFSKALKAGGLHLAMLGAAPALSGSAQAGPNSSGDQAAVVPPAGSEQAKIYTLVEAAELSKSPQKQMVFHYDANMPEWSLITLKAQAGALRKKGYFVIAVAGGPEKSVQIYINGLTSPKLKYDLDQIQKLQPMDYGAAYYRKIIGTPEKKAF